MSNHNIHTLFIHGAPLCVLCNRCGKRSLVPIRKVSKWSGKGDMTPISSVAERMRCDTCNLKQAHAFVPINADWADRWVIGEVEAPE